MVPADSAANLAVVVLAAGEARRMGAAKQLLEIDGKPMARLVVETALALQCGPVHVVLGSRAAEVRAALEDLPVALVENGRWREGMGASLQAGVASALADSPTALLVTLADQPLVLCAQLQRLLERFLQSEAALGACRYAGSVGVPAIFDRSLFSALLEIPPGGGCKQLIGELLDRAVLVDCPEAAVDIDTPAEYAAFRAERPTVLPRRALPLVSSDRSLPG
jgi:molybdenum cofactor cytidylyltransferase